MTPAQWRVLRDLVGKTEILASDIDPRTASALVGQGMIEDCPRMYFGPRTHRYRATTHGRLSVEEADAKRRRTDSAITKDGGR